MTSLSGLGSVFACVSTKRRLPGAPSAAPTRAWKLVGTVRSSSASRFGRRRAAGRVRRYGVMGSPCGVGVRRKRHVVRGAGAASGKESARRDRTLHGRRKIIGGRLVRGPEPPSASEGRCFLR